MMLNFINPIIFQIKFVLVYEIFSAVLDDSLQSLHPCQEKSLRLFKSSLTPSFYDRIQNLFRALQLPIRDPMLSRSDEPEVARARPG
jgi:hypothetical protein